MLNPFGYAAAGQRENNTDCTAIMKSVRQNMTTNKTVVREFIAKESNPQRRRDLEKIFEAAEELIGRFEGHRQHEMKGSAVYKELASKLFKLIRKQKHAGRKLFVVCLSNPLLGLDVAHYHYYTTIRGIKGAQIELMDDFIAELEGKDFKVEYGTDQKPIGMVNVPESCRKSAGKQKQNVKIRIFHADLKNDISACLASIFINHKVPIQWLETNIDTSELPNALTKKVNILINLSLVTEMTAEPIKIADGLPENADGFWDSDGSIEREAVRIVERSMDMDKDDMQIDQQNNNNNDSLGKKEIYEVENNCSSKFCSGNSQNSSASTSNASVSADPVLVQDQQKKPTPTLVKVQQPVQQPQPTPLASTPNASRQGQRRELPRPNESLASIGLPDEILAMEMISTAPLATPQPKKRGLERTNTLEPSQMSQLDTDSEEEIVHISMPAADNQRNANLSLASSQEINDLLKSINEMSSRFEKLEKSFKK